LLGRRPRRRLLLPPPPPPEGLPGPCPRPDGPAFIVLSKPAGPGFLPGAGLHMYRISNSPLVAAGSHSVGAQPFSRGGLSTDSVTTINHQVSRPRSRGHANFPCGIARWAGRNRERYRDPLLSGEANSYWRKQLLNLRIRLSVVGIRRAAGNGLGRGRPTRERGQSEQLNGTRPGAGAQGAKWKGFCTGGHGHPASAFRLRASARTPCRPIADC
jgi:hypothetical protein